MAKLAHLRQREVDLGALLLQLLRLLRIPVRALVDVLDLQVRVNGLQLQSTWLTAAVHMENESLLRL